MHFISNTRKEYVTTVVALFESGAFSDTVLNNVFDVEEDTINNVPTKYPVIVNIEMESWEADNKCFTFNGISFVYPNDLISGNTYQEHLKLLAELDLEESALEEIINTSGLMDKPIDDLNIIRNKIKEVENILF